MKYVMMLIVMMVAASHANAQQTDTLQWVNHTSIDSFSGDTTYGVSLTWDSVGFGIGCTPHHKPVMLLSTAMIMDASQNSLLSLDLAAGNRTPARVAIRVGHYKPGNYVFDLDAGLTRGASNHDDMDIWMYYMMRDPSSIAFRIPVIGGSITRSATLTPDTPAVINNVYVECGQKPPIHSK